MLEGGEDMGLVTMPSIILVIGVNGVGKTTTIGKMAAMYKAQGKRSFSAQQIHSVPPQSTSLRNGLTVPELI